MSATKALGPQEMPPLRVQIGFFAAVLGMFMAILDIQIVASSLNEIQAGVSASPDEIAWVQTAYLVAEVIMIPLANTMARIISTRTMFVLSGGGFVLASVGCAMSESIGQLIILRALQGFLGGAMIPLAHAISFTLFPRKQMGKIQALIAIVATSAPSIGPTLGGYITEHLSWHWLFLLNVIPGVVVVFGVWRFLDVDKGDRSVLNQLDVMGLVLMAIFLGTLEYILEDGPRHDWLASQPVFVCSVICAVSSVLFFLRVFMTRHPIVDLRLFRQRDFCVGVWLNFILGVAVYGLVYLMPLYFGTVRGFSSIQIGNIMAVTGIAMFLSAPILGRISDHFDLRLFIFGGFALIGWGAIMNANLTSQSDFYEFFWPQIIRGIGMMMSFIAISRVALGNLPPSDVGQGSGILDVMRNLGGAIGLALLNTIHLRQVSYHWNQMIPAINDGRPEVVERLQTYEGLLASTDHPWTAGLKSIAATITTQAEALAFTNIFYWLGLMFFISLPLVLLLRKANAKGAH